MTQRNTRRGFTLIELVIAVLIIGILAAVAVPQYKKAVLKSRFSTLMPVAQSVAKGNEVYYSANGEYADRKDKLDVEGPGTNPEGTQVNVVESDDYNYVIASRSGLPNNYIVYQAHSPKFAGNIHCEAEDKNTPAMELCKSLGGQEIGGSQTDGYITYVLEGTYGGEDKLPTSLSKLGQTLCGNNNECSYKVDNTTNTVSTQTCGNNISYTHNNGQQRSGTGHQESRYNAQGDLLEQTSTICNANYYATLNDDCVCVGNSSYEHRYSQDGTLLEINECTSSSDERGCYTVHLNTYIPDGINKGIGNRESIQKYIACSSGSFDFKTQTCPDGYEYVQIMNRNTAGEMTTSQLCTETACEIYEGNVRKKRETCTNGFNPNTLECNP